MWHSYIFRKCCKNWHSALISCQKRRSKIQKIWHQIHALYALRNFTHMYGVCLLDTTVHPSSHETALGWWRYETHVSSSYFVIRSLKDAALTFVLVYLIRTYSITTNTTHHSAVYMYGVCLLDTLLLMKHPWGVCDIGHISHCHIRRRCIIFFCVFNTHI